eukprot:15334324-Ditylum_brightwellii.AAC.1
MELLVNGTLPTSTSPIILSYISILNEKSLTVTLAAYQLAKAKEWGQIFSDATIEKAGKLLGHCTKITKEMYPDFVHDIPDKKVAIEKGMSENKINVLENNCWNHLCNIWLGGMTKSLEKYLSIALKDELEVIDSRL